MNANSSAYMTVFGMELMLDSAAPVENKLRRIYGERYKLQYASLKGLEECRFVLATPRLMDFYPTVLFLRNLRSSVLQAGESLPVVIHFERIDSGMKRALVAEHIPFISDDGNTFLPFLGIQETASPSLRAPAPLSPQAQRIAINLVAGRWVNVTASELAALCGKSRASVTKYLREIEAIKPSLLTTSWRSRFLGTADLSRSELLDVFEPYLVSPIAKIHRFRSVPSTDVLAACGARLSELSALSFFSDLAHDYSRLVVMCDQTAISTLISSLGDELEEAAWYEEAPFIIEEWAYPLDSSDDRSVSSTGLACVDPWSLYAAFVRTKYEDARIEDAVEQLRGQLCRL